MRYPEKNLLTDWATKRDIDTISEIALNTLKGNIKLSPTQFKKLKRHKKWLRHLASKKLGTNKKKEIVKQYGGFLPGLALAVATEIIPSLFKAVKKAF